MREKKICYFPEDFNPPTKYDLNIAKWLSGKSLDVSELIIVLGKDVEGELTQKQKTDIWDIYITSGLSSSAKIIKSDKYSPLSYIYKLQEERIQEPFIVALSKSDASDESFQKHFEIFPNYEVIITPQYDKDAVKEIKSAVEDNNFKLFSTFIPTEVSKEDKKRIFEMLKVPEKDPVDEVLTKGYWQTSMNELYKKHNLTNLVK